jgi:protein-disulfide isomerase
MKRYALPLSLVGFIALVFVLVAFSGKATSPYANGGAKEVVVANEWVRGNASSTVTLVEYSDFQCPACRAYAGMIKQLESEFGGKIAFIYRNFPLYQIHPNADLAARAAESAGRQGKFWEMHDVLFDRQDVWAKLLNPTGKFVEYATELGLNAEQFKKGIENEEIAKSIADDYQSGTKIGVTGTPTFVLNGVKIPRNPDSIDAFRAILSAATVGK